MNTKQTIKTIITSIVVLTLTVLVYFESGGITALAIFFGFGYALNNNRIIKKYVAKNNVSLTMDEPDVVGEHLERSQPFPEAWKSYKYKDVTDKYKKP